VNGYVKVNVCSGLSQQNARCNQAPQSESKHAHSRPPRAALARHAASETIVLHDTILKARQA
jgi:hypothetical protein